ncbi:MAG: cell division protein ZapA [Desulfobacterales bacterium]|nr:cell division protein ZapA [Desulfobacterales bacterium]
MPALEQIITIELLGEYFKFRADQNSRLDAREVADYLVTEVNQVASRFPAHAQKTNKLAIVVLAALNVAKQHMELKMEHDEFLESVASRASTMDRIIASNQCH